MVLVCDDVRVNALVMLGQREWGVGVYYAGFASIERYVFGWALLRNIQRAGRLGMSELWTTYGLAVSSHVDLGDGQRRR
jgi:hypothetical protein